jgi:uncharacterized integral membrane protein
MAERTPESPAKRSRTEETRQLLLGALILIAVLFAALNLDDVEVDLIFGSPEMPLIFVIVACLLLGALIDRLLARRTRRRSR